MNELLGKIRKKGMGPMNRMIVRKCKVIKEVVDRTSVILPSFSLPSFRLSPSLLSGSPLIVFAFSCPLLLFLSASHRRLHLLLICGVKYINVSVHYLFVSCICAYHMLSLVDISLPSVTKEIHTCIPVFWEKYIKNVGLPSLEEWINFSEAFV